MKPVRKVETALAIAQKDLWEALKQPKILTNILLTLMLVFFFHYMLNVRSFENNIDIAVYDSGKSNLNLKEVQTSEGSTLRFVKVNQIESVELAMGYRSLGLVLPEDFDNVTSEGGTVSVQGYINWVDRNQLITLTNQYQQVLSQAWKIPVVLDLTVIKPHYNRIGAEQAAAFHIFFAIFYMATLVIPFLILEEKRTHTMEALLVSPAGYTQVILGKMLAGLFFVILSFVLAVYLNQAYIIVWLNILIGALLSASFSILLALILGVLVKTPQQITLFSLPILLFFLLPAWFAHETMLTPVIQAIIQWLPTSSLVRIFNFANVVGTPLVDQLQAYGLAVFYNGLAFVYLVWLLRRLDR